MAKCAAAVQDAILVILTCGFIFGARRARLSISTTADLLWFSRTTVWRENNAYKKTFSGQQFYKWYNTFHLRADGLQQLKTMSDSVSQE